MGLPASAPCGDVRVQPFEVRAQASRVRAAAFSIPRALFQVFVLDRKALCSIRSAPYSWSGPCIRAERRRAG
jgi:hypothetical protein